MYHALAHTHVSIQNPHPSPPSRPTNPTHNQFGTPVVPSTSLSVRSAESNISDAAYERLVSSASRMHPFARDQTTNSSQPLRTRTWERESPVLLHPSGDLSSISSLGAWGERIGKRCGRMRQSCRQEQREVNELASLMTVLAHGHLNAQPSFLAQVSSK